MAQRVVKNQSNGRRLSADTQTHTQTFSILFERWSSGRPYRKFINFFDKSQILLTISHSTNQTLVRSSGRPYKQVIKLGLFN